MEWFGDGTISLVEEETVRTLKEGIKNRKTGKKGRKNKIPRQLQEAMREALKAQRKQVGATSSLAHLLYNVPYAKGLFRGGHGTFGFRVQLQ